MKDNQYGIGEPVGPQGKLLKGVDLDLVVVPTVAFTQDAHRIGMGGGYYDRAFGQQSHRSVCLVGVAFDCQEAEFKPQEHDVTMDVIVTESAIYYRQGFQDA